MAGGVLVTVVCFHCASTRVVEGPGYDRARHRCWQCGREFLFSSSTGAPSTGATGVLPQPVAEFVSTGEITANQAT